MFGLTRLCSRYPIRRNGIATKEQHASHQTDTSKLSKLLRLRIRIQARHGNFNRSDIAMLVDQRGQRRNTGTVGCVQLPSGAQRNRSEKDTSPSHWLGEIESLHINRGMLLEYSQCHAKRADRIAGKDN